MLVTASSEKAGKMIQTTQSFEARGPENRVVDVVGPSVVQQGSDDDVLDASTCTRL